MDMLKIRSLSDGDVELVESWLYKDHVRRWYEVPDVCTIEDWVSEIKGRNDAYKFLNHFIVLWEEKPIGFCLYYRCADCVEIDTDWGDTPLAGTYSFDYLIGEESHLGRGLGKAMIALLVKEVLSLPDTERIVVDTEKDNKASVKALLSNGFIYDAKNNCYLLTR